MSLKQYDFAYGRGRKTFSLDDSDVIATVRTEEFPVMADVKAGVLDAVRHPIGCDSLDNIVIYLQRSDTRCQ